MRRYTTLIRTGQPWRYGALMASFDLDADTQHPADFVLLRGGGVALYQSALVLDESEQELASIGYAVVHLIAGEWDESSLHEAFARELNFPGYYGRNLSALTDCLYDVAHGDYGWDSDATGLAVTLRGFGAFAWRDPDLAVALADTMARATREALLFGHRLLWLLQIEDGKLPPLGPLGCFYAPWNSREWLDAKRQ